MFLLSLLSTFGIAIYLYRKNYSLLQVPILAITLIVFILYFFSVLGLAEYGIFVIYILGMYLLITEILEISINFKFKINTQKIILYSFFLLPFLIAFFAIDSNYKLSNWDEFSIWAMNAKYMHLHNELYSFAKLDYLNYKNYPPAQCLYFYFFLYGSNFEESTLIRLQITLVLLTLLSVFNASKSISIFTLIGYLLSSTFIFYFHLNFNTLYVDVLLSFYFAATLVFILNARMQVIDHLLVSLMLFVLIQIKSVGLIFALIALIVYLFVIINSNIIRDGFTFQLNLKSRNSLSFSDGTSAIPYTYFIIAIVFIFLSFISWKIFSQTLDVEIYPYSPRLINFFQLPLSEKFISVSHNFLIRLNEKSFTFGMQFHYLILLIFISSLLIVFFSYSLNKIRDLFIFVSIGIGFVGYLLFLLYLYIVRFSDYEAIRLAGFERYISTYLIAWILLIFSYLIQNLQKNKILFLFFIFSMTWIALNPPPYYLESIKKFSAGANELLVRNRIQDLMSHVNTIPVDKKIFYLSQNGSGFDQRVFQYSALPRKISRDCGSIGLMSAKDQLIAKENGLNVCNVLLESLLTDYDYLVIYQADNKFWLENGYLFESDSKNLDFGVFKIHKSDQKIQLNKFLNN